MPRYKVENEATARALAKQWYDTYQVHCDVWNREQYWEVGPVDPKFEHPFWRELNDWFVAGRMSVVR
jgi:hypothetical protein